MAVWTDDPAPGLAAQTGRPSGHSQQGTHCLLSAPSVGLKSQQTHPVLSCRILRQILSAPAVGLKRQQTHPVLSCRIFRQILPLE